MTKRPTARSPRPPGYLHDTHRPLNSLVMVLPLLLFFHMGAYAYGSALLAPRHIGQALHYLGATAFYLPPLLVVVVLLIQQLAHRDPWVVQPKVVVGMLAESALWIVPIVALYMVVERLFADAALAAAANGAADPLLRQILRAVGAGVYEEFLFRLALISIALLLLVDGARLKKEHAAIAAVLVTAVLFSLYHFPEAVFRGEAAFPWSDFVFRAAAGAYLGGLYLTRGFGVAVGTHTFYNLFVVAVQ